MEFYGHTHVQPDGVTSESLFDPDDAIIEWQTFKHRLAVFKTRQLSLDDAYKPIFEDDSGQWHLRVYAHSCCNFHVPLFVYGLLREGFFVDGSHHDETPELYEYHDLGCEHANCVELSKISFQ